MDIVSVRAHGFLGRRTLLATITCPRCMVTFRVPAYPVKLRLYAYALAARHDRMHGGGGV